MIEKEMVMLSVPAWEPNPKFSPALFAQIGYGYVCYIRRLSPTEIRTLHPGLTAKRTMYLLYSADGTVLAMRRTIDAICNQANREALDIDNIH